MFGYGEPHRRCYPPKLTHGRRPTRRCRRGRGPGMDLGKGTGWHATGRWPHQGRRYQRLRLGRL